MGVMLTRYPELFGAIVCQVPLLDMRRYHLLLAGASWMAEYGDPDDPDDWAFISRVLAVPERRAATRGYPPVARHHLDPRRPRPPRPRPQDGGPAARAGPRRSYYENIEGGHGGAADNAQPAFKSALTFAFLWEQLTRP